MIILNLSSSSFLIFTLDNFDIFSYQSNENGGWNRRRAKSLTQDIAVNVRPCLSCFPILIVALSNVNPYDLWIVKPQASFNGSCFLLPLSIDVMGTTWGNNSSHGTTTKLPSFIKTYMGGSQGELLGLYTICCTTPRAPLMSPTWVHRLDVSITLAPMAISNSSSNASSSPSIQ